MHSVRRRDAPLPPPPSSPPTHPAALLRRRWFAVPGEKEAITRGVKDFVGKVGITL